MPRIEVLEDLLENVTQEQNYIHPEIKINAISTGSANYTSALYAATIKDAKREALELFIKFADLNLNLRSQLDCNVFLTEIFVYTELLQTYKKIQNNHSFDNALCMRFPKLYGYSTKEFEEVIVLENLEKQGYIVYDRFVSITWDYAAKAIEEIAKFHALSFAFKHNEPEKFSEVYSKLAFKMPGSGILDMWRGVSSKSLEAADVKYRQKLKDMVKEQDVSGVFDVYCKPLKHQVLCHGDYRSCNIMHRMKGNKVESLVPIDYQMIRQGSPVSDLMYFIFCGSDEEFRRNHFDNLLEHYYTILCRQLNKMNIDPEKVYSRADYDEELKVMLPYGLAVGIYMVPITTVDNENTPCIDANSSGCANLAVEPNDLYKSRFNGIINDYVRWGLL